MGSETTFPFIADREILDLVIEDLGRPLGRVSGNRYSVQVHKDGDSIGRFVVEVSARVLLGGKFAPNVRMETLFDVVRPSLVRGEYSGDLSINTANIGQVLAPRRAVQEEEVEFTVAKLLFRWGRDRPDFVVPTDALVLSSGIDRAKVALALRYFAGHALVQLSALASTDYVLKPGALQHLEQRIREGNRRRYPPVGYFREVPLPVEFDQPYVFVLMPFNDAVFPQRIFHEIIKPTLEEITGVKCWRADEKQGQLLITDQIYTQITRADAIVAEITTENPNVMIEIGVALANNKQVHTFFDKGRLSRVPFYLGNIRYEGYTDENELTTKLRGVRLPGK